MHSSLTGTALEPTDRCLESHILDASFRIIREVHDGNASLPCCMEYLERKISHVNLYSTRIHLSEGKYRQRCLYMAILLAFFSLASWLHSADRNSLDCLEKNLTDKWLCPIVLSHIAGYLRDCAVSVDHPRSLEYSQETIYPRPMIASHLLELADTTSPANRLIQAIELFQSRVSALPWAVGPGIQKLSVLVQTAGQMTQENTMLCVGSTWCSLDELQKPCSRETLMLSDVSRFRRIYD